MLRCANQGQSRLSCILQVQAMDILTFVRLNFVVLVLNGNRIALAYTKQMRDVPGDTGAGGGLQRKRGPRADGSPGAISQSAASVVSYVVLTAMGLSCSACPCAYCANMHSNAAQRRRGFPTLSAILWSNQSCSGGTIVSATLAAC